MVGKIKSIDIISVWLIAFRIASFIMQKLINGLACLTFLLTIGAIGSAYFGYKYITSPEGQEKIKKQIMDELTGNMPDLINKELPNFTQPASPTKSKSPLSL